MNKYVINAHHQKAHIRPEVYGHFSEHLGRCIYDGIFVGKDSKIPHVNGMRTDIVNALKEMKLPVLRWPGGCFADEYHWKDGIGEQKLRKRMVNTHWGGVVEDNSFGTHEFMELCRQLGCEPYINGNVGSGTVQEMQEWVEYMTFDGESPMSLLRKENGHPDPWKVKYFGVGNENWGCGGNMRPEYYADEYRRYQTYLRNFGENKLYKIACGPNNWDYDWTEGVMKNAAPFMDGLSLHYYTVPGESWQKKGSATQFDEKSYYVTLHKTLKMQEIIENHCKIMDRYDPKHRVGLVVDEWGTWYDVEPGTNPGFLYQQNTMRDALVAGINLNIFNKHADRVAMANIAQLINVLQSVILTEGDKMLLTPTYHVFRMYQRHQDAQLLDSWIETSSMGEGETEVPQLQESASMDKDGNLTATLCNLSVKDSAVVDLELVGKSYSSVEAEILTNKMDAYNTFEQAETVKPVSFTAYEQREKGMKLEIPACSVVRITLK